MTLANITENPSGESRYSLSFYPLQQKIGLAFSIRDKRTDAEILKTGGISFPDLAGILEIPDVRVEGKVGENRVKSGARSDALDHFHILLDMVQELRENTGIVRKCRKQVCSEDVFYDKSKTRTLFSRPFDGLLTEVDSAIGCDA